MDPILISKEDIKGQIYLITNNQNNKVYIGQTATHRKNKNKYRLYGYEQRLKTHISDALCNTKKNQSRFLTNSIRKYGKDAFKITLLKECLLEDADILEIHYIKEYNSLYPNGYNLTPGGKKARWVKTSHDVEPLNLNLSKKRGGCESRSQETRKKMSERLKDITSSQETREEHMLRTQKQHETQKYERFKDVVFDKNDLEQYIYNRSTNGIPFIRVKIGKLQTSFVGKHQSIQELQEKALAFLQSL